MTSTLGKIKAKLEEEELDKDMRSLLLEAVFLIEAQEGVVMDLQASITRMQKRYSELERNVTFRGFSGVAVWHGDFRLQLVEDKLQHVGGPNQSIVRLIERAKAELAKAFEAKKG